MTGEIIGIGKKDEVKVLEFVLEGEEEDRSIPVSGDLSEYDFLTLEGQLPVSTMTVSNQQVTDISLCEGN